MPAESHGTAREAQVREIAARLGVADFVYAAPPVAKGEALREASGDGLLLVGDKGAILQVKSREPSKGGSDSEDRATAWVRKNAQKAMKQGVGTRRELARRQAAGSPLIVWPVRAAHLPTEVRQRYACSVSQVTDDWPIIVVIDHPKCPEVDLGFQPGVLWITFEDWSALQRRLRSTAALINYTRRVLHDELHVPLGSELERYRAMRSADEEAALRSANGVPYLAHSDQFDALGTDLYHDVIDKVWPDDGVIPWKSADEYRKIVEFLDAVPPHIQSDIGRWFLRKRSEIAKGMPTASGLVLLEKRDRLVYACSHFRQWAGAKYWLAEFSALTCLRHTHDLESGAPEDTITLGVGALVGDGLRSTGVSYSFVMLRGREAAPPMPAAMRVRFEWKYGAHDHRARKTKEMKIGRNHLCPCMSGRKFKKCCGK